MRISCLSVWLLSAALLGPARAQVAATVPESIEYGSFGKVILIHQAPRPANIAIFLSDESGWDGTAQEIAAELAALDALVIGCDLSQLVPRLEQLTAACAYPAGDCEDLSQFIQQRLGYPDYVTPIIAGVGKGGSLAYAILAEAPSNTFLGGISTDFCPRVTISKPLCEGDGFAARKSGDVYRFIPDESLAVPWIAISTGQNQQCGFAEVDSFVSRVPQAQLVSLSEGLTRHDALASAVARILASQTAQPESMAALSDLPLVEVPADKNAPPMDLMGVHLTGDGGWSITDKGLAGDLAGRGIPVVGLNTLRYFWKPRTPDEAGLDLDRILEYYTSAWGKQGIVLIGYSYGADVLPFMVNRLKPDVRARVRLVVLLGPSPDVSFQFHFGQWLGHDAKAETLPTLPEAQKLADLNVLCIYGAKEGDSLCPDLDSTRVKVIERSGGHRILWGYTPIADEIMSALQQGEAARDEPQKEP